MVGAILAALALGMTAIAFWQRKVWVFMIAALIWIIMGANYLNGATAGTINWALGLTGVTVGFVLVLASIFMLRTKKEDEPFMDEDEKYNRLLDDETGVNKKDEL